MQKSVMSAALAAMLVTTAAGAEVTCASPLAVIGNGSVRGFLAAVKGDRVAAVQSAAGPVRAITQSVRGLIQGEQYRVTPQLAQPPGFAANRVTVAVNGVSLGTFTAPWRGSTALTAVPFIVGRAGALLSFTGTSSATDVATELEEVGVARSP